MTKWNHRSQVTACHECDGNGLVAASRRPTVDDPYPETRCDNCDGPHLPECEVCGFGIEVAGYDCLACDTIASLTDADFAAVGGNELAAAIMRASAMRRRSVETPLPTASESTVPVVTL